jgi:hypothetical protein
MGKLSVLWRAMVHTVICRPISRQRNNGGGVTIRGANSRCYGAPAAYACPVTSHKNRRGVQAGVFCRSASRLSGNCVVTRFYNNRGAVFSVLCGPCRGNIRQTNSEASSCRSTEEYKELSVGDSHGKLVAEELEVSL